MAGAQTINPLSLSSGQIFHDQGDKYLGRSDTLCGICFTINRLRVILKISMVNFGLTSAEFIMLRERHL